MAMELPEFEDWTSPSGAVGGAHPHRIQAELDALKKWQQNHVGIDAWAAGPDFPHPSQKVRGLYFFEGYGRLDPTGIQFLADPATRRGLFWLNQFSDTPLTANPAFGITADATAPGTSPIAAGGTLDCEAGVASAQINITAIENDTGAIGVQVTDGADTVDFSIVRDSTGPGGMNNYVGIINAVLYIQGDVADLGMDDGSLFYRTDTDRFRARMGGVTYNLATTADIPAAPTQFNIWPIVAKTGNYTAAATDGFIRCDATSASFTITLPNASGQNGIIYVVKKIDASNNTVTIDANGAQTIDGALTYVLAKEDESVTIISDGSNWHVIASSSPPNYAAKTGTYSALQRDDYLACDATSGSFTVTLYAVAGNAGRTITIVKPTSANVVTIDGNASETINGMLTYALSARYSYVTLLCTGAAWLIVGEG